MPGLSKPTRDLRPHQYNYPGVMCDVNWISEYNFMFTAINSKIFKILKSHSYNHWASVS